MNIHKISLRNEHGHGKNMDEMVKQQYRPFCKVKFEFKRQKKNKFVEKLEQTQTMCNSLGNYNDEILKTVERLEAHKETLPVEQTRAMCNSIKLRII